MAVTAVTTANFDAEVLNAPGPVLVDFWAEWCGPCRMVAPVLDEISNEHGDKLKIVKLNVDENPEIAMKYQITSIPALKVFANGEVATEIVGAKPRHILENDLAAYLK